MNKSIFTWTVQLLYNAMLKLWLYGIDCVISESYHKRDTLTKELNEDYNFMAIFL